MASCKFIGQCLLGSPAAHGESIVPGPKNKALDMLKAFNEHGMFFGIGENELAVLLDGDRQWAQQIVQAFSKKQTVV